MEQPKKVRKHPNRPTTAAKREAAAIVARRKRIAKLEEDDRVKMCSRCRKSVTKIALYNDKVVCVSCRRFLVKLKVTTDAGHAEYQKMYRKSLGLPA